MIELRKLTKKYSNCTEIEQFGIFDIDLKLPSKGLFTICGESGCGKTTLLNVLGLIDTYDSGEYLFDDKEISTLTDDELSDLRKNDIGFIFQDYKLFEKDTVYNNICSNFIFDEKEIDSILELVNLLDYKYTLVSKLSGGQKQRIAIVRALIKQCKLVIADEPTGNLDEKTADEIMSIFKQISKDRLVLLVTHDEELAHKYADEIIFMDEGKIISNNYINVVPDQIKVTPIKKEKKKVNLYSFLVNNILNPKLKDKLSLFIMELFVLLISLFSFSIITISRPNVINQALEQTIVKDDLNLMVFDDSGVITKGQKFVCLDDKVPTHKFYQSGSFSFERLSVNIYLNDTIKTSSETFWFKNNGITIICKDFVISGRRLKLQDFSIVNGGQTTTLIYKSEKVSKDIDFYLPCKVIRIVGDTEDEKNQFSLEISKATNSQKAIKNIDILFI